MGATVPPEQQKTPKPHRRAVDRQRARYKEAGLVQVNFWVPASIKAAVLSAGQQARNRHLHDGGWLEKWYEDDARRRGWRDR